MLLTRVPPRCVSLCRSPEMIFHGHPWLLKVVRPGSPLNGEPRPTLLYMSPILLSIIFPPPGEGGDPGRRSWGWFPVPHRPRELLVLGFGLALTLVLVLVLILALVLIYLNLNLGLGLHLNLGLGLGKCLGLGVDLGLQSEVQWQLLVHRSLISNSKSTANGHAKTLVWYLSYSPTTHHNLL